MKKITFLKTAMQNFCCVLDLIEYTFENDKIRLITGPNGVGKSTIFSSISFALYGVTQSGLRGDDVVNNIVGKNCHVHVEFTIEVNNIIDHYKIDRYVKDSKLSDTVLLFKNKNPKPYKKGQKEVLPEIEKLVMPQKLFNNTLLFGQKVKDFFTDLTDSDQKAIFRKVILLDDYVLYYDETNKRIKLSIIKLNELDASISLNDKLIISTNNNIHITKESIKNFELKKKEEIQALTYKINQLNDNLLNLQEIEKKYVTINDLELNQIIKNISSIKNEIDKLNMEKNHQIQLLLDLKKSKITEFQTKANELISKEKLEKSNLVSEANNKFSQEKEKFNEELSNYKNIIDSNKVKFDENKKQRLKNDEEIAILSESLKKENPICPTCGKNLTDVSVLESLKNKLIDITKINKDIIKYNDEIISSINIIKEKITIVQEKAHKVLNEYEMDLIAFDGQCNEKIHFINQRLETSLEKLNVSFNEKMNSLELEFDKKKIVFENEINKNQIEKENLELLFNEKQKIIKKINDIKMEIESNKESINLKNDQKYPVEILEKYLIELEKLKNERIDLDNKKLLLIDEIEILEFWKEGFSSTGIPSILIDESIPFLNNRISNYLEMVGGRYIASFDTLSATKAGEYRDKIKVNVLDTKSKANNRKQFSGGQTRIIDIAILLSLCDLQNTIQDTKTNILLLDEIFDSLDDQNIGYVSSLLRTLIKEKSINIISHRHIDTIEADEILRLFD